LNGTDRFGRLCRGAQEVRKMQSAEDVLAYWLDELGPRGWFAGGAEIDQTVRDRFGATWAAAAEGGLGMWLSYPSGTLAYIVVTDQFPRNIFRGTARAYSTDRKARAAAEQALDRGWDLKIDPPARQFFYMPFEHSECQTDQDRAVRLMKERLDDPELLLHARAHRDIIRRFGRFPFRNAHLGRTSTAAEAEFLARGGYPAAVKAMMAA
jgi:uncharacterized protein (DUF924 family)